MIILDEFADLFHLSTCYNCTTYTDEEQNTLELTSDNCPCKDAPWFAACNGCNHPEWNEYDIYDLIDAVGEAKLLLPKTEKYDLFCRYIERIENDAYGILTDLPHINRQDCTKAGIGRILSEILQVIRIYAPRKKTAIKLYIKKKLR